MTQAALAARARQELALTIARWAAVAGSDSVLPKLNAQLVAPTSATQLASSALAKVVALARLTAKTSIQLTATVGAASSGPAASKEALGAAAAAWSQLPWPVGSTQLLRMAVSATARVAVSEAMASSADQPAFDAWQTAGRIVDAVTQALQQADLPVRSLPQAAFGPIVAATLSADADSHAGRGAVAVATALLIRAAGALQTQRDRPPSGRADGTTRRPTGAAHRSAQGPDLSEGQVDHGARGPGNAVVVGNLQRMSSSRSSSSSGSGASSSNSSGSSSGTSASSGSASQSNGSSSGGSTATSRSTGSGSSSADSQQRRGEHQPGPPDHQAEVAEAATIARMPGPEPARVDIDTSGAATAATSTVQAAAAEPDPTGDAGRGGVVRGNGAADSGTEAESGEIGVAERGAKSPSSSGSGSSGSSSLSGSSSGSASRSTSGGSSASASAGSRSSGKSSGPRQQPPARHRGPQTAMEARAVFECALTGSQDRCAAAAA